MQLFFFDAVTPEIRSVVVCLQNWGYDVLHADNSLAGFDLYKANLPPIALINMDENQKKKIFTIFYSTKGSKGTGLGLFIANKAVQKHGGYISVNSESGEGTTFHIRLPLKVSREM